MPGNSFLKWHRKRLCDRVSNLVDHIRIHVPLGEMESQGYGAYLNQVEEI